MDFKELFLSQKLCDTTLNVNNETFQVHKSILAARSSVFTAMFENDMAEKNTNVINILDYICVPTDFREFLLYLYSGDVDFSKCNVFHLYAIADKYDIQELKSVCTDYMLHTLSVENVCETFLLAKKYDEARMITEVQTFFRQNFAEIIYTASWNNLLKDAHDVANDLLKEVASKAKSKKKKKK